MSNSVSNYGKARDFFRIAVVIDDKVELETSEDRVSHSILKLFVNRIPGSAV